jgi:hypothetical protein
MAAMAIMVRVFMVAPATTVDHATCQPHAGTTVVVSMGAVVAMAVEAATVVAGVASMSYINRVFVAPV